MTRGGIPLPQANYSNIADTSQTYLTIMLLYICQPYLVSPFVCPSIYSSITVIVDCAIS